MKESFKQRWTDNMKRLEQGNLKTKRKGDEGAK